MSSAHRRDAARASFRRQQRVDDGAVVGAVAGRLHDYVALEPEQVAQLPEFLLRRVARRVLALGRIRKEASRAKHVTVRIDRARRHGEARPRRIRMEGQPVRVHREWTGGARRIGRRLLHGSPAHSPRVLS
jgi:hypothetical protein